LAGTIIGVADPDRIDRDDESFILGHGSSCP
jgi:hypothetical protein